MMCWKKKTAAMVLLMICSQLAKAGKPDPQVSIASVFAFSDPKLVVSSTVPPGIRKSPARSGLSEKGRRTLLRERTPRLANNTILTGKPQKAPVVVGLKRNILARFLGFVLTITLIGGRAAAFSSIVHYTLGSGILLLVAVPLAVNLVAFTLIKIRKLDIGWAYTINYIACMVMACHMPLIWVLQILVPEISGYFGLLQRVPKMTPYVYMQAVLMLLMTINHFGLPLLDSFLEKRKYSVEKRKIVTGFLFVGIGVGCVGGILVSMGRVGKINPDFIAVIFTIIGSFVSYSATSELYDEFANPNSNKRRSNLRKLCIFVSLGLAVGAITLAAIYLTPRMIADELFVPTYVKTGGWIRALMANLFGMPEYARDVMPEEPEIVSEQSGWFLWNMLGAIPNAIYSRIEFVGQSIKNLFFEPERQIPVPVPEYIVSYE
jgi:hypothetical protein